METMRPEEGHVPHDDHVTFEFEPLEPSTAPPPAPPRRTSRRGSHRGRWLAAALVVAVFLAGVALGNLIAPDVGAPEEVALTTTTVAPETTTAPDTTTSPGTQAPAPQLEPLEAAPSAVEEPVAFAAAVLRPSIVQIDTQTGLGSGFIYDESGLILTAAHVVSGSTSVLVTFADGSKVDGVVVGQDELSDVAVVSVSVDGTLPAAELALEDTLIPGQLAVAIGSPFGLEQTITAGIVSNVARPVVGRDGNVRDLIQTDASINSGNSGGALADRAGRVIGINDLIFTQSGGNDGVGFAIPITYAKLIADQLVAGEMVETARLGVSGTDPERGAAGALITSVASGSPADEAGLRSGDLIVAIDDEPVLSFVDLAGAIRSSIPGEQVELTVVRDGEQLTLEAQLTTG